MPLVDENQKVFISAVQVGLANGATLNIPHLLTRNGTGVSPDWVSFVEVEITPAVVGADSHLNVTFDATNIIVYNSGTAISGQYRVIALLYTKHPIG